MLLWIVYQENIALDYLIIFEQNENKSIIIEDLREIKKIEILEVSKHYEWGVYV